MSWGEEDTLPRDGGRAPTPAARKIGPYELYECLGEGGMGAVYRAHDPRLGRMVALKILHADRPASILRFRREAKIVARLRDPRIAEIYEFSEDPPYIAMRLVDGVSIDRAPGDRIAALRDAARAIARAHAQGVVHRDLKPANILVDAGNHPFVLDFGIAKSALDQDDLTRTGKIAGTPGYMSPEQARGARTIDARTDVYGLGATLYHIIAGRPPHGGDDLYAVIRAIVDDEPTFPDADRDLLLVTRRALAKDPALRYASADDLADDLDRYLTHRPVLARPPSALYRARKAVRRHPIVVLLSVLLLVAAGAIVRLAQPTPGPAWIPVITEDFADTERALPWSTLRGAVTLHDGALCARNGHAVFAPEIDGDVRVEYSARFPDDAIDPREASLFISGSEATGLANGYSAEMFIGDDDARWFHAIARARNVLRDVPADAFDRHRAHRYAIERRGARLRTEVDGLPVLEVVDPAPLAGPDHVHVGIGSKADHIHYDDIQVQLLPDAARSFAARSFEAQDWPRAEQAFGALLARGQGDPTARVLHAAALVRLHRVEEARAERARVSMDALTGVDRFTCELLDVELAGADGDLGAALARLRALEPDHSGRFPRRALRIRGLVARLLSRPLDAAALDALHADLERTPIAVATPDVAFAVAERERAPLAALPPAVRPLAATWYGYEEARAAVPGLAETALLFTQAFVADRLADVGLWAIATHREAEAPQWLDQSDRATIYVRPDPHVVATFAWALIDPTRARARLAATDNDQPDQLMWSARTLLVLGEPDAAMAHYRRVERGWRANNELYPLWEARRALGLLPEGPPPAGVEVPPEVLSHRAVIDGLVHDLAGRRDAARAAYARATTPFLANVGLRLLAERRGAALSDR